MPYSSLNDRYFKQSIYVLQSKGAHNLTVLDQVPCTSSRLGSLRVGD